jgi:hypothetical protein
MIGGEELCNNLDEMDIDDLQEFDFQRENFNISFDDTYSTSKQDLFAVQIQHGLNIFTKIDIFMINLARIKLIIDSNEINEDLYEMSKTEIVVAKMKMSFSSLR